ncbi:MAG: hypothetical protein IKY92_03660 [Akkermansia sp.]|nr:hypothetical protein [Akkermansia sp.]
MENWTPAPDRPGYRRKIIQRGPATIIIDRPELDDAAAAKAQEKTRAELEGAMRSYHRRTAQRAAVRPA